MKYLYTHLFLATDYTTDAHNTFKYSDIIHKTYLVVPREVLGGVLEHLVRDGVPDALVGQQHGLGDVLLGHRIHLRHLRHVRLGQRQQKALHVLGGAAQPVLQDNTDKERKRDREIERKGGEKERKGRKRR